MFGKQHISSDMRTLNRSPKEESAAQSSGVWRARNYEEEEERAHTKKADDNHLNFKTGPAAVQKVNLRSRRSSLAGGLGAEDSDENFLEPRLSERHLTPSQAFKSKLNLAGYRAAISAEQQRHGAARATVSSHNLTSKVHFS